MYYEWIMYLEAGRSRG